MTVASKAGANGRGISIDIRQVNHSFDLDGSSLQVLDNVSLSVGKGEFVSLLGPSGCGKSTLLRLISGLTLPSSGSIVADGQPVTGPDRSRILVFQDPTLFPWMTVWKNVAVGLEARGTLAAEHPRVDEAIELVRLDGFADAFPHQLSGGMAQRVALARALVNDPPLLLLDEPLGKLDSLTRLAMQRELLSLWQGGGFTALLVTHDVEEALLLSDRVLVLSDRPARILNEFRVDLPHPRRRDAPELVALRAQILGQLQHDGEQRGTPPKRTDRKDGDRRGGWLSGLRRASRGISPIEGSVQAGRVASS